MYNRTIYLTTNFSVFKIVYGFNPLTHLDLLFLHANECVSLDDTKKAKFIKHCMSALKSTTNIKKD